MEGNERKLWKGIAIVFVCTAVDLLGHLLGPQLQYDSPSSIFADKMLFLPAISALLIITFGALAAVFSSIQGGLPGKRLSKGLRFGGAFAGLWFIAMPGMSILFNSPLWQELYTGAIDGGAILLLILLMSVCTATEGSYRVAERSKTDLITILMMAVFYCIGRYLHYPTAHFTSAYVTKPLATLTLTLGTGLWIGIMYRLLGRGIKGQAAIKKALGFGGVIFGIDWLLFNLFGVLFVDISVTDMLVFAGVDTFSVIAGIFVFERFCRRRQ